MRLKKLILHGFKSFADRTEFVFDSPITGIVGPNGCGKSNVVDGFKWVLGEQSAKSLRGEAMMDVIFNGSGSRKPAGMAEVVLVFENPKRDDGTRTLNLEADEVAVGRRLYRDGASEYHVNNKASRLKDIRELFLDTGVGVDAYSVIEQGRVAALLEANPEERRLIFEEAAGISKFKARKKECQRKLEKVDQNLLRVTDIVEEVEKRLRSVKVQAGRARNYQEHHTRLQELRLTHALHEYHSHHTQVGELDAKHEDTKFRLEDAAADLARKQNELAEKRQEFEAVSQKKQQFEYDLVQAGAALQTARQRHQYAKQQLQQIADQVESFNADRARSTAKLDEVSQGLGLETETLRRLSAELEDHRRLIDERQSAYKEGQLQLNQANQQIEGHKSAILDLMRKLAQVNSRLGAIEIERRNIATHQSRLADRRQVVLAEMEALETQRADSQTKLDQAMEQIRATQSQLEARRAEAQQLGHQIAQVSEQLGSAKEHRSGLQSRQKLLKDLEAKREGVSEGVKSVLRQREQKFPFVRGLVADFLRVDVEHAHVIEAALDGRDQWLVTAGLDAALAAKDVLEDLEGRVNLMCASPSGSQALPGDGRRVAPLAEPGSAPPDAAPDPSLTALRQGGPPTPGLVPVYDWNQHPQRIRFAMDLVRTADCDTAISQQLLGRTVIVDNLVDAAELHRKGPPGWRYVTHDGAVLEADGVLRAGPLTAAMGLLSRRSELDALDQQLADVDSRIQLLTRQLTDGNVAAKALEEQQNALRNEVYRANTVKVEVSSKLSQINDKQSSLRREQPVLDKELQNLLDGTGKLKTEETALVEKRQAFDADQASRQQQVNELTIAQKDRAEEIRQLAERLTASRVQLGQVQEKQLASQQQVQRMTSARAELLQQVDRLSKSMEAVAAKVSAVEAERDQAGAAADTALAQQGELRKQIEAAVRSVAEAGKAVQAFTAEVESLRAEHVEVEAALHALELRLGELKVRLETLVQRTIDELQLDLPTHYHALSIDSSAGYIPGDVDWEAVTNEIRELREKIQRLGNVNLDAIGEQDELEKRSEFLSTQVADLNGSKKQLEDLIAEINAESSIRFEQTFNAVREHFQELFRKLFGGGKADIFLETEIPAPKNTQVEGEPIRMIKVDVLEAGIEIIARPPGKQPVSISQLSGGEKTMTCVALLMSIFKSKPSPFCILDEVDAALDEANNQRFNQIVQEFLTLSQFIVITHSKRTMQIADVLYGVTMQEQGVSKRVAVKFDQVDPQGRITETAAA